MTTSTLRSQATRLTGRARRRVAVVGAAVVIVVVTAVMAAATPIDPNVVATTIFDPNAPTTIFDPNSTTTSSTSTTSTTTTTTSTIPGTIPPVAAGSTVAQPGVGVESLPTSTLFAPIEPVNSAITSLPEESTTTTIDPLASTTTVVQLDANGRPINPGIQDPDYLAPSPVGADDSVIGDAEQDAAPVQRVSIPYGAPLVDITLKQQLAKLSVAQQKLVAEAQARIDLGAIKINAAKKSLEALTRQGFASRDQLVRLRTLRDSVNKDMRRRALRQYTGESSVYIRLILDAKDVNSLRRRADIVSQAQRRDAALVESYRNALTKLETEEAVFEGIKSDRLVLITELEDEQKKFETDFQSVAGALKSIQSPVLQGFVFPVQLPVSFTDTYGADRMVGTPYFHPHQGVDIFAPEGTPLRAVKRGIVTKIGAAKLGGWRLWLIDGEQNYYYYAHLSAYAAGIYNGKVVEAGEIIGFLGHTGNAVGTPNHLHFEIHPGGKGPVNPTPILQAVKDANVEAFVRSMQPVIGGVAAPPSSGPPATLVGGALAPTTLPAPPAIPSSFAPNLDSGGAVVNVPTSMVVRTAPSVSLAVPKVTSPSLGQPLVTAQQNPAADRLGASTSTSKPVPTKPGAKPPTTNPTPAKSTTTKPPKQK
jgi:murein DD-endopeptidase MepM/ murein hydrolase activator NlpD